MRLGVEFSPHGIMGALEVSAMKHFLKFLFSDQSYSIRILKL